MNAISEELLEQALRELYDRQGYLVMGSLDGHDINDIVDNDSWFRSCAKPDIVERKAQWRVIALATRAEYEAQAQHCGVPSHIDFICHYYRIEAMD